MVRHWSWAGRPAGQGGITYLGLLFAVALAGIALAGTGSLWLLESQREKEKELLFVGEEYRRAIASYYEKGPGGRKEYPLRLEDLLEDKRFPQPVRHLRRLYRDPLTGKANWELLRVQGGIAGVASTDAGKPIKVADFSPQQEGFDEADTYRGWRFMHGGSAPAAASPMSSLLAPDDSR